MRLSTALTSLYLAANAALASPVEVRAASTPAQPTINHLLSASILIGTTLKPISSVGGPVRQIEPIVGGNITGAINATVSGGFAFPQTIVNNTIELVQIGLYGVTSDGYSFYVSEKGVGTTEGTQFTRLVRSFFR